MMEPGKKPEGLEAKSKDWEAEFDFEPEEKHKTVAVSEKGVAKAEKFLGIDNLYNAENGHLVNHLQQALKAESLYKRDVDYAVIDGQVKIIDEFTGRILEGRRWSEGLHQAVEAKEGVAIQEENQTVATITYQNYFRRYEKLAGMTGTAITEATEFMKIYELQVVEIPTNRPMVRKDNNDQIYKTKDGKWAAVAREIEHRTETGQPVLVGTISVEVSELLSTELTKRGIKHTVLNAKPEHAEREGEIIAEAGAPGAVTIATNMAGRGVDIKLGGNEEHLTQLELTKRGLQPGTDEFDKAWDELFPKMEAQVAADREKVMEAGGLFILGTERHESRRIDNQLRGRSGRQGDPGESRFYLSAEDDLVRLFAGDRIYRILDNKFLAQEDDDGNEMPIEHKMLTKQIEGAQKKVEDQNFLQRKRVLEYDDVMNQQREIIYEYRDRILEGEDMSDVAHTQIADAIERLCGEYMQGDYQDDWDLEALFTQLEQIYPTSYDVDDIVEGEGREAVIERLRADVVDAYNEREQELGDELMRALERFMLLQIIDNRWREHLHDMDYLREGIHLRGFAQIDPLVAYKNEGFEMFTELMNNIWDEFARYIFNVEVSVEPEQPAAPRWGGGQNTANWMKPIYDVLGITVGTIQSGMHDIDKQEAYSRDVVYGTNSEFGFDYLRDNLADTIERKAQRGHGYAIVDEVDNILIDEARTPLIISGSRSRPRTSTTSSPSSPGSWSRARSPKASRRSRRTGRPTTTSSPRRSTRRSRSARRASPRPRSSWASTTSTTPRPATSSTTCTRRSRPRCSTSATPTTRSSMARRRSSTSSPAASWRAAPGRRACTKPSRRRRASRSKRRTRRSRRSPTRTTSASTTSSRA